jgi:hypothetical protein
MQASRVAKGGLFPPLIALCAAGYILFIGLLSPFNNWDLIGYIASALSNSGQTGIALHDATYAELQKAIPPDQFDLLTGSSAYVRGVFQDPEALEQQLPFYRIRSLYILGLQLVSLVTHSLAQASHVISAVSATALALVTAAQLSSRTSDLPVYVFGAALITILYLGAVPQLARLSTPDALFSLAALSALVLFNRSRTVALVIIAFLPLIRTDAIVLSALLLVLLWAERDRKLLHYAALAVSVLLYAVLNAAYGNYGHLALFNFTFISGQRTPYPETLQIARDPAVYIDVYLRRSAEMLTRWVPWILLAAGAGVGTTRLRRGHIGPEARLVLVCIGYVLLHFLAFPMGAARHYSFALIFCGLYIARLLVVSMTTTRVSPAIATGTQPEPPS